jgi:hypothetical protein
MLFRAIRHPLINRREWEQNLREYAEDQACRAVAGREEG